MDFGNNGLVLKASAEGERSSSSKETKCRHTLAWCKDGMADRKEKAPTLSEI